MLYWFLKHLPLGHLRRKGYSHALTLIELLLTIAIAGTLAAIAVPTYTGHIDKQRNTTAIVDIVDIESQIEGFRALNGRPPNNFGEAGIAAKNDPWGNAYEYMRLEGLIKTEFDAKCRWDKQDKPLNFDYDLYSKGKDGITKPKISHADSYDDIIRAGGGSFKGLAHDY